MTAYPEQGESFLRSQDRAVVEQSAFRYSFSLPAMIEISHIIEDAVLDSPGVADLHVSFQYMSRLLPQQARYTQLATLARGLWLYGVPDVEPGALDSVRKPGVHIVDTEASLLVGYWFVIAYGPGVSLTLLAEEVPAQTTGRTYEGFYTFEPQVAHQVLGMLNRMYSDIVPTPAAPDALA